MNAWIFGLLPWAGVGLCAAALGGPEPRAYSAMAYDAARGVCVLYGGTADCLGRSQPPLYSDTWEWDGRFWRRRQPLVTPSRALTPGMVYDSRRDVCVLVTNGDATWEYAAGQWRLASTEPLAIPVFYSMGYDSRRGVTVLHGGWVSVPNPWEPWTWEWDASNWRLVSGSGPEGHFDAMAFDDVRGVLVDANRNGTSAWDGNSWTSLTRSGPTGFGSQVGCYDSSRGVVVFFGSLGIQTQPCSTPTVSETWEWDGAVWTRRDAPGPSPRFGPAMAYDRRRGVSVLFGGYTAAGLSDETWEWDGSTWRQPSTCYADCDTSTGIGSLDVFDYLCFQNEFAAGSPYACDCETSSGIGVCDIFDFLCFQNRFVNGCR